MATKLQITITPEEEALLRRKAARLGYDVTKFVKFLLSREAYEQTQLSDWAKTRVKAAMKDYTKKNFKTLTSNNDIDEFMDSLQA